MIMEFPTAETAPPEAAEFEFIMHSTAVTEELAAETAPPSTAAEFEVIVHSVAVTKEFPTA
jgi:hypothetical protein